MPLSIAPAGEPAVLVRGVATPDATDFLFRPGAACAAPVRLRQRPRNKRAGASR
jgi:hypothetical protein